MTTVAATKRGLNPKTIATLAEAKQQGQWTHSRGLVFAVAKSGTAFWAFRYQTTDGKRRLFTLAQYDGIDTAKLRSLEYQAHDLRKQVKAGRDPIAEKAIKVAETANRTASTFEDVARVYIEQRCNDWKGGKTSKHYQAWVNTLETYVYKHIGHLAPHAITTVDVLKVLQQPHHGKNSAGPFWNNCRETANRVRNRIELILSSAKAKGLSDPATKGLWSHGNPAAAWEDNLKHLLSGKRRTKTNFAAVDWKLAPAFMHDLQQRTGFAANALQLTILCASRTGEIIGATWSEFDLDNALWTVPKERMKANAEHRIPLAPSAVELLRKLPKMHQNPFVFAGVKQGCGLHNMAMLQCLHTLRTGLSVHGFRSAFKDWTEDTTVHPASIVETALAHSEKDKTVAAYRRSDALERRRILMAHWSDYLLMIDRDAYRERWSKFIAINER